MRRLCRRLEDAAWVVIVALWVVFHDDRPLVRGHDAKGDAPEDRL